MTKTNWSWRWIALKSSLNIGPVSMCVRFDDEAIRRPGYKWGPLQCCTVFRSLVLFWFNAPRFVRIVISVWFHTTAPLLLLMSNFLSCAQVILWWRSSTSHGILSFCSLFPCFLNTCHALWWHLHPSVDGSPPVQSVKWSFRSVFMGVQPTPHLSDPRNRGLRFGPVNVVVGGTWLGLVELPIFYFVVPLPIQRFSCWWHPHSNLLLKRCSNSRFIPSYSQVSPGRSGTILCGKPAVKQPSPVTVAFPQVSSLSGGGWS